MLVLTRKRGESLMIGDGIEITVLGVEGDSIKLGIQAPLSVQIHRKEVYLAIRESNKEALQFKIEPGALKGLFPRQAEQE